MFNGAWLAGGIPRTACVAAYEPICAVSLADSYINRANPGMYTASALSAVTFSESLGWQRVAGVGGIDTGVVIAASSWTSIVRHSGAAPSAGYSYHYGLTAGGKYHLFGHVEGLQHSFYNNGSLIAGAFVTDGVMAIAGQTGYLNGVAEGAIPGPWTGGAVSAYVLECRGLPSNAPTAIAVQAVYIYNITLTPTQVKAVTDAMLMLPMRPKVPRFRSWMTGGALTQFRKAFGLRTGSRGVPE